MAAGCVSRTAAASASLAEAWNSLSAWMIFCATLAFGLRLPRDGSLHRLRNIHLFDFHFRYLDTPGLGILINDYLQLRVYLFALRIESVLFLEFYLAFDVA